MKKPSRALPGPEGKSRLDDQIMPTPEANGKTGSKESAKKPGDSPCTLESFAAHFRLPIDFLKGCGLSDATIPANLQRVAGGLTRGVEIPCYRPDGSRFYSRYRIRLVVAGDEKKMLHPQGMSMASYGQNRLGDAKKAGYVVIPEGESDALTLWYHDTPGLSIPGASNYRTITLDQLEGVQRIYVVNEKDAGAKTLLEGLPTHLASIGWPGNLYSICMPDGFKDPSDLHRDDPERFVEQFKQCIDAPTFIPLPFKSKASSAPEANLPPKTITADVLSTMDIPPAKWTVPGIFPQGLCILAGKPKTKKSFLVLGACLAVATGGTALGTIPVEQAEVLYMALEDTTRRLKDRMNKMLKRQGIKAPKALHLATEWKRSDKGGLDQLRAWLSDHPKARLVVIDTWVKFRPPKSKNADESQQDYDHAGAIKQLAEEFGVTILIVAHNRKMSAPDPMDEISGTLGFAAAADGLAVIRAERGRADAVLFVFGRDVEEAELALQFDPTYCLWSIVGDADEFRMSKERAEIVEIIRQAGKPMKPSEVAKSLGKNAGTIRKTMASMSDAGQIRSDGNGSYSLRESSNSGNSSNSTHTGNSGNSSGEESPYGPFPTEDRSFLSN